MAEDEQKDTSKTRTGLTSIFTALGGGAGIAAIIAAVIQVSKPSEPPPNPSPVSPVVSQSDAANLSGAANVPGIKQLAGIWRGNRQWGDVNLQQEGAEVRGAYSYDDDGTIYYGYVKGDLTGTTLNFTWWEDPKVNSSYEPARRGGYGYLVLSGDSQQLAGKWRSQGESDWTGDMVLSKK